MHESSSGLIALEICNNWKVLLVLRGEIEKKIDQAITSQTYAYVIRQNERNGAFGMLIL